MTHTSLSSVSPTSPVPAIRLVCLDLGGVLIRVCRNWEEACRLAKLDLPGSLKDPDLRRRLVDVSRQHETGRINDDAFDRQVAALVGLSPGHVGSAAAAWLKGAYPGAADLVGRLAKHPALRSACLSNTNPRHWRMMTEPGPHYLGLDRLAWRFTSFEIGHMKPAPDLYAHVERVTEIEPGRILFFDDNPDNLTAARARGWSAEPIDPAGDAPGQVVRHLARYGVQVSAEC